MIILLRLGRGMYRAYGVWECRGPLASHDLHVQMRKSTLLLSGLCQDDCLKSCSWPYPCLAAIDSDIASPVLLFQSPDSGGACIALLPSRFSSSDGSTAGPNVLPHFHDQYFDWAYHT